MTSDIFPFKTIMSTHLPVCEEDGSECEVCEEDEEAGGDGDGDQADVLHQLELDHLCVLAGAGQVPSVRGRGAGQLGAQLAQDAPPRLPALVPQVVVVLVLAGDRGHDLRLAVDHHAVLLLGELHRAPQRRGLQPGTWRPPRPAGEAAEAVLVARLAVAGPLAHHLLVQVAVLALAGGRGQGRLLGEVRGLGAAAELAVEVLEAGGEDGADVRHVDEHQRDPEQRVHDRHRLAEHRARGQVAVPDGGEDCEGEHERAAEGPHALPGQVADVAALDVVDDVLLVEQHQPGHPVAPLRGLQHVVLAGQLPDALGVVVQGLQQQQQQQ